MRVLVTGFGGFRGIVDNPSHRLAVAIGALERSGLERSGLELAVESPLPVEFEHAADRALARARAERVDAILCLGLARRAARVRVEAIGRRSATSPEPDEAGRVAVSPTEGPEELVSPIAVDTMVEALIEHGVAAERSDDAGGYVCNDLYYRVLRAGVAPAVFVHVPELPAELGELSRAMVESLRHALDAVDAQASDRSLAP